jgi:centromeric protein E
MRMQLEEERRALAAFVTRFDSLTAGLSTPPAAPPQTRPRPGGAIAAFVERQRSRIVAPGNLSVVREFDSPIRMDLGRVKAEPSLLEERWDGTGVDEESFEIVSHPGLAAKLTPSKSAESPLRDVLKEKENVPV